jgi:hypothetical protein
MFSRVANLALVMALTCSVGLHWGLLQTVAWVGMLVSYSQDASLKEAMAETFDGKHPCALCKEIAKAKRSERKSQCPAPERKLEYCYLATAFVFTPPADYVELRCANEFLACRIITPPVPPPKRLPG